MSKLVIVESPAKAKTIEKYLGADFEVMASMGHVRDLPKSKLGIDVENDFTPQYINMRDKKDLISKLKKAAKNSDTIYLATDPDREGEAISWHLAQLLSIDMNENNRVAFNEITKTGVQNGMKNLRKIDIDLVDAQQARRVLDRLVGYKLSPFLWKKIKSGLSAGRVQSVALRLIVDREKEIRAFVAEEYWSIDSIFNKLNKDFASAFHGSKDGKKIKITGVSQAKNILAGLNNAEYVIDEVKKGVRNRQPAPPFITSTLQQEASRKLNYIGQRTMSIAQQLYEGIDIPGLGTTGLITYMRTDSLRISEEARAAGNEFIKAQYGENYLPEKPRYYKSKNNAQDAHEAIRPTMVHLSPDKVRAVLSRDQYNLYKLVWERFIASLMAACVQDTVSANIVGGDYMFKASGFTVRFDGFTTLYIEGNDDENSENSSSLPKLEKGDTLKLVEITPNQHFTAPPARYTEPTLIKALDENGIGRPSTYAPIIGNILHRDYIERDKKSLLPTVLGETVADLMIEHFNSIVDVKFTAKMESDLDKVESGDLNWIETIRDFYTGFEETLTNAEKAMDGIRIKVPDVETDVICELCGRNMVIKSGRFGKFLACPGYPDCKNTKAIVQETPGFCPLCGGKMLQKKSKSGYKYFGCEKNTECKFMTWDVPTAQKCPDCGKTLFKGRGGRLHCCDEQCGYENMPEKKYTPKAKSTTKSKSTSQTAKSATKKTTSTTKKSTTKAKDTVKDTAIDAVLDTETKPKTTAKSKSTTKKSTSTTKKSTSKTKAKKTEEE
ncbi:MAG: type I DNA topoisomerase [Oscillospiraceae bacterium]|nr:type I DNA topoisomerase [Oscillospiraceae bacterium]